MVGEYLPFLLSGQTFSKSEEYTIVGIEFGFIVFLLITFFQWAGWIKDYSFIYPVYYLIFSLLFMITGGLIGYFLSKW